jgi:hypothetical protein
MKKSRRQKQRRRRQSRKQPRISRGGAFGHYLGHAIEAATICAHTIHLVKNVNNSIETLTFCQRINTAEMRDIELIAKFEARLSELREILKLIAKNRVIIAVVSFTVRFFDGKPSSELRKLTNAIPNAEAITDRSLVFDDMFDATKIFMWGEWYNTEVTEATNNLIAVVTEMIALQIGLPMKPLEEKEEEDEVVPAQITVHEVVTPPENPYGITTPARIASPHVRPPTKPTKPPANTTVRGATFTIPTDYDDDDD